ncbi:TIM barrel protein [Candidatus Micrarchaeota archaeon]|nr:TIM barrel protein [Candidatus Micrarchaeota archaeon]
MNIRFGPAGIPIQCKGNSTLEGVQCCRELGLEAMEMEFVQGVKLKAKNAVEIGKVAEKLDISLSSHAPYFVNFCSVIKEKQDTTLRNIYEAAKITHAAGGRITVFHPGYYQKLTKEEAYEIAKRSLRGAWEKIHGEGIKIALGAETVGKRSQFGGFDEVIRLSQELDFVEPVIDFAHMHARGDAVLKGENDYRVIFTKLEKQLGDYVKHFHSHFSEIEYTGKGERNHIPLGTKNVPPFKPLMKVLAENGYSGVIICESPKLDLDALKMQAEYRALLKKRP